MIIKVLEGGPLEAHETVLEGVAVGFCSGMIGHTAEERLEDGSANRSIFSGYAIRDVRVLETETVVTIAPIAFACAIQAVDLAVELVNDPRS